MKRLTLVPLILSGFVAGCVNPDLPAGGFFTCTDQNPQCPEGWQCQAGKCVEEGNKLDSGSPDQRLVDALPDHKPLSDTKKDAPPKTDLKMDTAPKPDLKKDTAPKPDLKKDTAPKPDLKKDTAPKPDLKKDTVPKPDLKKDTVPKPDLKKDMTPVADKTPWPDKGVLKPVVSLLLPTDGYSSKYKKQPFTFTVSGPVSILYCNLTVAGVTKASVSSPSGTGSLLWKDPPDGTVYWDVACKDKNGSWGYSNQKRKFTSYSTAISGCKSAGWTANTKYKLTANLSLSANSQACFILGTSDVLLDGGAMKLISAKRKDAVIHRWTDETHTVLLNGTNSGGTTKDFYDGWVSPQGTNKGLYLPHAADLDGDGDLDLITTHYYDKLRVWESDGKGGFGKAATYISPASYFHPLRAADFDNDGDVDFAAGNDGGYERFYRGISKTSSFAELSQGDMGTYTHALDLGDFNNDGKLDLVTGNSYYNTTSWGYHQVWLSGLTTTGSGSFSYGWKTSTATVGATHTYVADFDKDDQWDLLTGHNVASSGRGTFLFLNTAGTGKSFTSHWNVKDSQPAAAEDMDRDGDTDVIYYKFNSKGIYAVAVARNSGSATFGTAATVTFAIPARGIRVGDVNNDGYPDFFYLPGDEAGKIRLYKSSGKGLVFNNTWTSPIAGYAQELRMRDLDNDGYLDLLASIQYENGGKKTQQVLYFRNDTKGGFAKTWDRTKAPAANLHRLTILGDLNGPLSRAIWITGNSVTVRNFPILRGFSTGVEVSGLSNKVSGVIVTDPDLYGFRVVNAKYTTLENIKVHQQYRGVGVGLSEASSVTLDRAELCKTPGHDPQQTPLSLTCYKSSISRLSNSSFGLTSGCGSLISGWKTCK